MEVFPVLAQDVVQGTALGALLVKAIIRNLIQLAQQLRDMDPTAVGGDLRGDGGTDDLCPGGMGRGDLCLLLLRALALLRLRFLLLGGLGLGFFLRLLRLLLGRLRFFLRLFRLGGCLLCLLRGLGLLLCRFHRGEGDIAGAGHRPGMVCFFRIPHADHLNPRCPQPDGQSGEIGVGGGDHHGVHRLFGLLAAPVSRPFRSLRSRSGLEAIELPLRQQVHGADHQRDIGAVFIAVGTEGHIHVNRVLKNGAGPLIQSDARAVDFLDRDGSHGFGIGKNLIRVCRLHIFRVDQDCDIHLSLLPFNYFSTGLICFHLLAFALIYFAAAPAAPPAGCGAQICFSPP